MATESTPKPTRWGILATGGIASTFTKDLLLAPSSRQVTDVAHVVVAAASSSSATRAREFLTQVGAPPSASAYGSYAELVADPAVDIVYVATPHSHHFQHAMLCLQAGKHVLCEKAFTVNAAQAEILVATARERGLFLMEAVWIRFFPLCRELRAMVAQGAIGKVHRVFADLSFGKDVEAVYGTRHRLVNMDLAGGAMLDIGIYSLTWVFQFLYHVEPEAQKMAPSVVSSMTKYNKTGADENTVMVLTFPTTRAIGVASCSLRVGADAPDDVRLGSAEIPAIRIQGEKGEIQVFGPAFRPEKYRIAMRDGSKKDAIVKEIKRDIPGHGMFWEADECARCLRDGKQESEGMKWSESVVIMKIMDEIRRQNDLEYPEKIESIKFPLDEF